MNAPALAFVTDFADQAVILPLAVVVAVILWAQRRRRVAAAWLVAIFGVLGVVLTLKVACYACGGLLPILGPSRWALQSPSGHAASAAVVYGGVAALSVTRTRPGAASGMLAALVTAVAMAGLIGATRVQLGAHSLSEVAVAASIGVSGAVIFTWLAGPRVNNRSGLPIIAGVMLVLLVLHGYHLPVERSLRHTMAQMLC